MIRKTRAFLLSLTIITVLVLSAFGPTSAYADGGTPTEPPPTDGTNPPERVTLDVNEFAQEPNPCTSDAAGCPAQRPAKDKKPSDKPILETVPDNTTVTVLSADGVVQPLVSQAAVDAVSTGDPIWCPSGVTPVAGANGCTQSFASFGALLTFLSGNVTYTGAGTIYLQQGANSGSGVIDFNNYDLTNISSSDLTIAGGWNPSGTVDPTTTSNFSNVSIVIGSSANPWGGSLTITNLNLTSPTGTGLTLYSQADINLDNVTVTQSKDGAGAELNAGNDVNINNSNFERNRTAGAIVRAVGDVAVANSTFNNPGPTTGRTQKVGLDIIADGTVSLFNVLANHNREIGVTIDAGGRVSIADSVFSGTKILNGSEFLGYGLQVITPDAIDLNNVTANDNFLWGAWLMAGGDVAIANSIFNGNTTESPGFIDDTGLLVESGGNVSLLNVTANENRLIGATIEAAGDVSISNSDFSGNNGLITTSGTPAFYGYGLQVVTPGNIFLNGVTATGNTLFGALLDAGLDVSISNSTFSDNSSVNTPIPDGVTVTPPEVGRGLEVTAGGNVLMDNVVLSNNQTFGADIQAGESIFLDTITATGNGTTGVQVTANCTSVFLINGTYSDNGQYGLSILNGALTQAGAPIFANNGAGNIFEDPGTCVFTPTTPTTPTSPTNPTTPNTPSNPVTSTQGNTYQVKVGRHTLTAQNVTMSFQGRALTAMDIMTLNSFVSNAGTTSGLHLGLFTGQYMIVDSPLGLQIFVLLPAAGGELAMNGS